MRYCERCGEPQHSGPCRPQRTAAAASRPGAPQDGIVRLARDKKGRGGKVVTLVLGVPGEDAQLAALAQELKRYCGSGGTVKDGVIEIQGEHRERLAPKLTALGYKVKTIGG